MTTYKRLFLSDTHIGHPEAKVEDLLTFLDTCEFQQLYLLGDIFDDKIRRHFFNSYRGEDVELVAAYIAKRALRANCVVRLTGNHDPHLPVLDEILPATSQPYVLDSHTLLTHGHFEEYLWRVGGLFNSMRRNPVKRPPARTLPMRERAAAFMGVFRRLARLRVMYPELETVIHGHLHTPGIRHVEGVRLVCLPDWLDNAGGAVVEFDDGRRAMVNAKHEVKQWLDERAATVQPSTSKKTLIHRIKQEAANLRHAKNRA